MERALCVDSGRQIAAIALFDIPDQDRVVTAFITGIRSAIECDCRAVHSGKIAMIELEDVASELVCPSRRESKCNIDLFGVNHVDYPFVGGFEDWVALSVGGQTHQNEGRID